MAIYLCDNCGEMKDDDYDPCVAVHDMDMVCTSCATELEEEDEPDDGDYAYDNWKDKQLEDADGTSKKA